jgi:hypothetical protein
MTEKGQPPATARIRFGEVRNAEDTANYILIDVDTASQRDLLADAGTAPKLSLRASPARETL